MRVFGFFVFFPWHTIMLSHDSCIFTAGSLFECFHQAFHVRVTILNVSGHSFYQNFLRSLRNICPDRPGIHTRLHIQRGRWLLSSQCKIESRHHGILVRPAILRNTCTELFQRSIPHSQDNRMRCFSVRHIPRRSKIQKNRRTIFANHDIVRTHIPMNDSFGMNMPQRHHDRHKQRPRLKPAELSARIPDKLCQCHSVNIFHDNIYSTIFQ